MAQYVSEEFIAALKSGRQFPISKVEILDGTTRNVLRTISGVDEGTVTIDVNRGTRRTFQLRLSNADGEHTPTDSSSAFAFSRLVRVYRGLKFDDGDGNFVEEYVLLGTFMVDRTETLTERNMSVLTVDGSDLWKKIASGGFPYGNSFPVGTHINTVIAAVAEVAGIEPYHVALDPLNDRDVTGYTTGTTIQWEPGENRSEFLLNLAKQWGISIFFNPLGILTSAETPNLAIADPVWSFAAGEDAVMLGVTRVLNDLTLVNHVIVTGESSVGVPLGASPTLGSYFTGTMANGAYALVASGPTAGIGASPVYVAITGVDGHDTRGTITFVGTDSADEPLTEVLALTATALQAAQGIVHQTIGLFKTLTSATQAEWVAVGAADTIRMGYRSPIGYEIADTDPSSPTYIGLIGDRVLVFVGPQITTLSQAQSAAEKLFAEKALIEEDIRIPMICLPHLEGNDVIHVHEPTWTKVSERYICGRFDIPLRESRMTIEAKKARTIT